MGTLQTPDGPERIRGALVLEDPDALGNAALAVVANSPVPCEATAEDDPATVRDEEAEALAWWADGIEAAAFREGAVVVMFALEGFPVEGETPLGSGFWLAYRVNESGWEDGERVLYDYDADPRGSGEATIALAGDEVDIDFEVGEWSASVRAPRCTNAALTGAFAELYRSL